MTCIVGIECSDGAIIAGDYCGSDGFTRLSVTQPKIFSHSGMMFGYTSTFRFGQIIEHMLDDNSLYPPSDKEKTYEWLVRNFVPKLKTVLAKEEYTSGGNAIMLINGQVWELQPDHSVLRSDAGVISVGSGTYHMISSILTQLIAGDPDTRPTINEATKMVKNAYDVVSLCVPSVSAQHNVMRMKS